MHITRCLYFHVDASHLVCFLSKPTQYCYSKPAQLHWGVKGFPLDSRGVASTPGNSAQSRRKHTDLATLVIWQEQHPLGRSAQTLVMSNVCVAEGTPLSLWKWRTDRPCSGEPCPADRGPPHPSGTVNSLLDLELYICCKWQYFIVNKTLCLFPLSYFMNTL